MKGVVAAMIWIVGFGIAQADVYKWTDPNGEVHYGEFPSPPNPSAERIMTQQQIQQVENADKKIEQNNPSPNTAYDTEATLRELQHRDSECERYKNLRIDRLMNSGYGSPVRVYPLNRYQMYGLGYGQEKINVNSGIGMSEIMAGIQKYCQ